MAGAPLPCTGIGAGSCTFGGWGGRFVGKLPDTLLDPMNGGAPTAPTARDAGGTDGAWFTGADTFCGNEFGKSVTLLALAWIGVPVFVLAMSARALRMADVSAGGAPLAWPPVLGCSEPFVKGMKSFGGLPSGVVDFTPTVESIVLEAMFFPDVVERRILQSEGLGVLPCAGASSFSLNEESISLGNVFPRSQMSMSFLILA